MTTLGPLPLQTTVLCIICHHTVPLSSVTAGSLYADTQQAFACTTHLSQRAQWIVAWALFDQQQRQAHVAENIAEPVK